jgi:hypothetical protein
MEVAKDDNLGRKLQDAKLTVRVRAPRIFKNATLHGNPQVTKIEDDGPKVRILKKTDGSKK